MTRLVPLALHEDRGAPNGHMLSHRTTNRQDASSSPFDSKDCAFPLAARMPTLMAFA